MTPETPLKDYGIAVLALTALIFIFKYVFAYLTHISAAKSEGDLVKEFYDKDGNLDKTEIVEA